MYSKLSMWSRWIYLAGIVLALVLVVPTAWFPFQLGKIAIFAICLAISAVLFVVGGGTREVTRSYGFFGLLLVGLLPIVYVLSALRSIDPSVAYAGFGVEADTVLFVVLASLAFVMSFSYFRTLRGVRMLLTVVFWSLIAASVFQLLSILFGAPGITFATFADRSVNLVGKWNDLGILVGLLSMFLLERVDLGSLTNAWRIVVGIALAALAVLLGIINFSLVWGLVLAFSVVIAIIGFLTARHHGDGQTLHWSRRMPWFSVASAVISILFLFFGSSLNLGLTKLFPVSSLEVRPSYGSTMDIISAARNGSFERTVIGTGPNTFGDEWILHKPAEVNQSSFWNLDFNVGFSTLVTALGTVGLLGVLAWFMPLLLVVAGLIRVVRLGVLSREDRIVAATLGIASLFTYASLVFYAPSQNLILLAFVLTGASFGFLWRQGQPALDDTAPSSGLLTIGTYVAMAVVLVLALWSGFATSRRLVAEAYVGKGTADLSAGNVSGALADANKSSKIETTGDALRLLVNVYSAQIQQLSQSKSTDTATLQQQFAGVVQSAINAATMAQKLNPEDYRPTLQLGQIYDFLSTLNVQGAANTAATTYAAAQKQNPTNPSIPLAIARLAATQNDQNVTTQYLTQALTLKPNYTDAILLVVQLDVANKDIPSAIKAATAAAQTAPGVAPIWFELGLLYYSAGDAKNAATALTQAVNIQSDYANAKYFLGLSDYILKDNAGAIKQFQDLAASNPDNSEVKLILSNLQAGKDPFAGAQPPVTNTPQDRSTAPISQ